MKDREGWHAVVHGVAKSWTHLGICTTTRWGHFRRIWAGRNLDLEVNQAFFLAWPPFLCTLSKTYPLASKKRSASDTGWAQNPSTSVYLFMCACSVAQSCLTACDPLDCSLPGSSVHGIFQARILEWVAMPSSRGPSHPRAQTCISCVSCIGKQILYHWATWEAYTYL